MNVTTSPASLHGVSAEEWQIRCDLAVLYRLTAYYKMTDFIYTHISARIPGPALIIPPKEVCEHAAAQFASQTDEHVAFAWEAALRLIENDKPDYRS